jgi:hypothetical protein
MPFLKDKDGKLVGHYTKRKGPEVFPKNWIRDRLAKRGITPETMKAALADRDDAKPQK